MQHVEVSRVIDAPVTLVFERYCGFPSWTRWARLGSVTLQPGGADGVGAHRVIRNGPLVVVEEITAVEPPRRLDYRVVRGFPIREHAGWVTFTPCDRGTSVVWECEFESRIPGAGLAFEILFARFFANALAGLDADLATG